MKLLLLLLITSIPGVVNSNVRSLYSPVDTVKGKSASFYRIEFENYYTIAKNTCNVDTTRTMYFDNGEEVPWEWELGGETKYTWEEIIELLKGELTLGEWGMIKGKVGFLQIWIVADKAGNPLEIDFTFRKTDPVFSKIAPDRLFQLEGKLKKLLKLEVGEGDRRIKNVKHFVSISYRDLE